jgi:hypothetical protein
MHCVCLICEVCVRVVGVLQCLYCVCMCVYVYLDVCVCVYLCLYVERRDLTTACGRVRTSSWLVTWRAVYLILLSTAAARVRVNVCVAVVALAS